MIDQVSVSCSRVSYPAKGSFLRFNEYRLMSLAFSNIGSKGSVEGLPASGAYTAVSPEPQVMHTYANAMYQLVLEQAWRPRPHSRSREGIRGR